MDTLQRFIFEHANIRGDIAHLDETFTTIINQHPYPTGVKKLLGEAMLSCLLLTGSIKFEGSLSLQFQGDERLPLLIVQCDHQQHIRAFAQFGEGLESDDYLDAYLKGTLAITISQDNQTQPWQSIVPIQSTSMSENLMHYFAQSEQIPSYVCLAVSETQAAGLLLQLMPEQDIMQREQFWEYAVAIGQTIKEEELLNLDNVTLLHRLYHETELRLFDSRPVRFQCRCSRTKMKQVLRIVGEKDCQELLAEAGAVEVNCDFCNRSYRFDPIDVTLIFQQQS